MKIILVPPIKSLTVQFSFFLMLGIILGFNFQIRLTTVIIFAILTYLALIFFYIKADIEFKSPIFFSAFTAILFVVIGILSIDLQKPKNQKSYYSNSYFSGDNLHIRIDKTLKTSTYYNKYEGEVILVNGLKTQGKILINKPVNFEDKSLVVDDILLTNTALKKINKALNPNTFDYKNYLQKQGIYHQINLQQGNYSILSRKKRTLRGIAFTWREKINTTLNKYNYSPEELSIINAILLGQRNNISKEIFENYKNAGAIHILAVSGLHIGIILLFLNLLLRPLEKLKHGKNIKLIFVIILLWIYAFIAGLSASVVRAVTMFMAVAIGIVSNRPSSVKNSLVVSFFILLLVHPLFLFDVGFQLSYTAVFSIVWLQPYFKKLWKPKLKIVKYLWQLLSISFAAQIGLLPLSLYYFHQFPGLFFISSMVIIPFLGFILGLGILVIMLSLLQILPFFIAKFYGLVIKLMNNFVGIIAEQKSFIFEDIPFSFLFMLTVYFLLISTLKWVKNKTNQNLAILFIAIISIQITVIYERSKNNKTNEFIVFHQIKNTLIGNRQGNNMTVYQNLEDVKENSRKNLKSFSLNYRELNIKTVTSPVNVVYMDRKKILILDSLGIYKDLLFQPEIIIITQSPRINLERLIDKLHPEIIIADGSNFKSYVHIWEKTCEKEEIEFFNTSKKGAYQYGY